MLLCPESQDPANFEFLHQEPWSRPTSVCPSQVHVPTLVMNGDRASYDTFFLSDTRYLILDTKASRHSRRVNIDE